MTKPLTILAFAGAILWTGIASADDDCFVPMTDWQPREAVTQLANEQGWTVRRIKIHDGCYEIIGQDAQGRSIEATVHPATLDVLELEYKGEGGNRTRGKDGHDD
ncbi:PepSY domain-containing protein [Roseibium aggregatum]|uniref:PepSY domain-containing protein n=1 Tax=Roseibium aggregatum TaxID=187304 RepID=A0A926NYD6_9HYPH|nr:PepSY domain-containing protein [Roseibium aggregatum]MBD1548659.1 PepSY domain-containing protein [Roseibium aggregatum]